MPRRMSRNHPWSTSGRQPDAGRRQEKSYCRRTSRAVCSGGGLSPVLNREWLRWRRVTHAICCLGAFDGDGEETQAWRVAQNARAGTGNIQYQNWCVNRTVDQRRYLQLFTHLRQTLGKVDSCVYVHCRSGKDRSALTIYAFLRGSLGYDDDSARRALATRVDRFGQPAANVDYNQGAVRTWLQRVLRDAAE